MSTDHFAWLQTRAAAPTAQRFRAGTLSSEHTERLRSEVGSILVGCGVSNPDDSVIRFITRAVMQYIETTANLAIDVAAIEGTELSSDAVATVLAHHGDSFQASQSAELVLNLRKLRSMTLLDPAKAADASAVIADSAGKSSFPVQVGTGPMIRGGHVEDVGAVSSPVGALAASSSQTIVGNNDPFARV